MSKQALINSIRSQRQGEGVAVSSFLSLYTAYAPPLQSLGKQWPVLIAQLYPEHLSILLTLYMPGITRDSLTSKHITLLYHLSQQLLLFLEVNHRYENLVQGSMAKSHGILETPEASFLDRIKPLPAPGAATSLPHPEQPRLVELVAELQSCLSFKQFNKVVELYLPLLFPEQSGRLVSLETDLNRFSVITQWGDYHQISDLDQECRFIVDQPGREPGDCVSCQQCHSPTDAKPAFLCEVLGVFNQTAYILQLFQNRKVSLTPGQVSLLEQLSKQLHSVMKRLQLLEDLQTKALQDPLTGLMNRRYMEKMLANLCQSPIVGFKISVILIDIDYFKRVNDTYGHQAGDAVLRDISILLKGHVRSKDIVCRYGGEEFCMVLLDTFPDVTLKRAETIRRAVRYLTLTFKEQSLPTLSISLGIAHFPDDGNSPEELIARADKALYWAKNHGRDRSVCFDQLAALQ